MTDRIVGDRIIVLGCSGSGKSTFARRLRDRTGLPLIHLDNVWWRPDRTHITREAFDRRLEALLQGERWIIEGDYSRTYAPRFRACDTVIFLDYNEATCMEGIRARIGKERPDIPWVDAGLDPELVGQVRDYRRENRPKVYALIGQYPAKRAIVFRTRREAGDWLSRLAGGHSDGGGSLAQPHDTATQ